MASYAGLTDSCLALQDMIIIQFQGNILHPVQHCIWQHRSDTCSKCDELNVQLSLAEDESEKEKVKQKLELHHRKAEKGYTMLRDESKAAKESWNGETRAFDREPCTIDATDMYTFDFQQNLPLPTLTHSDVFYCRQLGV